jgi:hypothetical protein
MSTCRRSRRRRSSWATPQSLKPDLKSLI